MLSECNLGENNEHLVSPSITGAVKSCILNKWALFPAAYPLFKGPLLSHCSVQKNPPWRRPKIHAVLKGFNILRASVLVSVITNPFKCKEIAKKDGQADWKKGKVWKAKSRVKPRKGKTEKTLADPVEIS